MVRKALKVESESSKSNKDSDVLHFESHSRHLNVHEGRQCRLLAWANGVATLCVFAQVLMIVSETERKKKKKKEQRNVISVTCGSVYTIKVPETEEGLRK